MGLEEMGKVVMFVNSLERRAMSDDDIVSTAVAWHELLGDLDYEDVRTAVKEYFMEPSEGRFFRPGDVAYTARRLGERRRMRQRPLDQRSLEIQARHDRDAAERRAMEARIEVTAGDPVARMTKQMTKEF